MLSIRKSVPFAIIALAISMLATSSFAQNEPSKTDIDKAERKGKMERRMGGEGMAGRRAMRMHGRMIRGFQRLELSDAQKTQMRSLMETHRTANKPLMDEMRTLMDKRREGAITEADKARIGEIRQSMRDSGDQLRSTLLGLLTPEQTQKLEQMRSERQERMEMRKGKGMHRKEGFKQRKGDGGAVEKKPVDQ